MDYRLKEFIKEHLPEGKQAISRDAVEILLKLLWKQARESQQQDQKEQDFEDKHGPRWI